MSIEKENPITYNVEQNDRMDRIYNRMKQAGMDGNERKQERLEKRFEKLNEKAFLKENNINVEPDPEKETDLEAGGIAALAEAPNIVRGLTAEPESRMENTGNALSLGASGLKIGMATGNPVLAGVLGVGGFLGGLAATAGFNKKLIKKEDKEVKSAIADSNAELLQNYYGEKTAAEIKADLLLHKNMNGYNS